MPPDEKKTMAIKETMDIMPIEILKERIKIIHTVMKEVMQDGVHYGKIPGCGDKPALLKPGAEKIMATFHIAPDPQIADLSTPNCIHYRIVCRALSADGIFLGAGVGEASSNEEKYQWRAALNEEEFNVTPETERRVKFQKRWQKNIQTYKVIQVQQIRTNPADIANTVLKMAKKRSLVDMTLTVTAASDIFTQAPEADEDDIEDKGNGSGAGEGPGKTEEELKKEWSTAETELKQVAKVNKLGTAEITKIIQEVNQGKTLEERVELLQAKITGLKKPPVTMVEIEKAAETSVEPEPALKQTEVPIPTPAQPAANVSQIEQDVMRQLESEYYGKIIIITQQNRRKMLPSYDTVMREVFALGKEPGPKIKLIREKLAEIGIDADAEIAKLDQVVHKQ